MIDSEYKVRRVSLHELNSIRCGWKCLECGHDMTFFQKYEWYELVSRFVPTGKSIECGFHVVEKRSDIIMIAPLWIIKHTVIFVNHPGVFMLGRKGYSDYLNIIYDVFDEKAFYLLAEYVKTQYGVSNWFFENLRDSDMLRFIRRNIQSGIFRLIDESTSTYCGLMLPNGEDEYLNSLSRKVRQNIRTAINRAKKDSINFTIYYDDDDTARIQCMLIREEWLKKKIMKAKSKLSMRGKTFIWLRGLVYDSHLISFPKYSPIVNSKYTKLLTIKNSATGEIAAFFNYGIDREHSTIVVIAAAVNEKYCRYSPGLVCIKDFICHCIAEEKIVYFDFTRGNEPYKYWLGCKDMKVTNISISL